MTNIYNTPSVPIITLPKNGDIFFIENFSQLKIFPTFPEEPTTISYLNISRTGISKIPDLSSLNNLSSIDLGDNAILKLPMLPDNLSGINLSGNPLICVTNKPPGVANALSQYPICPE